MGGSGDQTWPNHLHQNKDGDVGPHSWDQFHAETMALDALNAAEKDINRGQGTVDHESKRSIKMFGESCPWEEKVHREEVVELLMWK